MSPGHKLLILGGIIVGFWLSGLMFSQITLIPVPYVSTISAGTGINSNGELTESFAVVPEVTILTVTGFALLILGIGFVSWEKIKTNKKQAIIISGILLGILSISLILAFLLQERDLYIQNYDVNYVEPNENFDLTSVPHSVEIMGLKQTYDLGEQINFTISLRGNGTFCKGYDLQIHNLTSGKMWGNMAEQNVCSNIPIEFERILQYSSFPSSHSIYSDKLIVSDFLPAHLYPAKYQIVFVTGYGDVLKRTFLVTNSSDIDYDFNSHSGPENIQTEITGEDALAICAATRIPCPSNPIFRGGKLDEFTKSTSISTPDDLYEILLNKTHVCVTSTETKTTECSLR